MSARRGQRARPPFDAEAFAREYERAAPLLWTLAAAVLGERSQADDVLQEACVIALQKLEQFDPGTSFRAWMGTIVRLVALNHVRKRRGGEVRLPASWDEEDWSAAPTALADAPEPDERAVAELVGLHPDQPHFDDRVVAALRLLTPVARACLILRSVRRLEYRELAPLVGVPEGTAMSHVHRARALVRAHLESQDSQETQET